MKQTAIYSALFLICALANAQSQFTNTGNVQIFPGASVSFFGNFVNNGTFTDQGGVYFYGSSSQIITGTSPVTFYNLQGNNATGITMQRDVAISNVLTLTAGPLILNGTTLTINNSASTAVARVTGYIVSERTDNTSKVRWNIGTNTSAHVYSIRWVYTFYAYAHCRKYRQCYCIYIPYICQQYSISIITGSCNQYVQERSRQ